MIKILYLDSQNWLIAAKTTNNGLLVWLHIIEYQSITTADIDLPKKPENPINILILFI